MHFRTLPTLAALSLLGSAVAAPAFAQRPGWQHLDLAHDSVFGISTTRAYELLKGKKATTVIVGIVDTGIDTTHEDLRDVIWSDPKTGVHGWNYIGPESGREDITRLVDERRAFYDSLSYTSVPETYRAAVDHHRFLAGQLEGKRGAMRQVVEELTRAQSTVDSIVAHIGKPNPTVADFKAYTARNDQEQGQLRWILLRLGLYPDWAAYRTAEITDVLAKATFHLEHGLNLDNHEADTATGNADVSPDKFGAVSEPNLSAYHGTHVAGIIGAVRGNNLGADGVADHVKILMIKDNGTLRELRDRSLAKGIRFAVDHGAKVINLSFGKPYSADKAAVDSAVRYAMQHDVLLVHAAGNNGQDLDKEPHFPNPDYADKSGAAAAWLEVGASSPKNDMSLAAGFSNYGKQTVDVFAPGVAIYSTLPHNQYDSWEGTSMATPVVAGLAALIREYYPKLTAPQVREIIVKSVVKSPYLADKCRTGGVVNAYNAIKLAATY